MSYIYSHNHKYCFNYYFSPYCDSFTNLLWEPAATSFVPVTSNNQVSCQLQKPKVASQESVKCFMGLHNTYGGMGLYCRKVSGSGVFSRGQSFFPAVFPKELRSFLASFFGVFTIVSSSSRAQLHNSTFSSNWGTASLLPERTGTF